MSTTKKEHLKTQFLECIHNLLAFSGMNLEEISEKLGVSRTYLSHLRTDPLKYPSAKLVERAQKLNSEGTKEHTPTEQICVILWRGAEMTYAPGHEQAASDALASLIERTASLKLTYSAGGASGNAVKATGAMLSGATGKGEAHPPSVGGE